MARRYFFILPCKPLHMPLCPVPYIKKFQYLWMEVIMMQDIFFAGRNETFLFDCYVGLFHLIFNSNYIVLKRYLLFYLTNIKTF